MRIARLKERVSPPDSSQGTKPGTHHYNAHQRASLAMIQLPCHRSHVPTRTSSTREPIRLVCELRRVAAWCENEPSVPDVSLCLSKVYRGRARVSFPVLEM